MTVLLFMSIATYGAMVLGGVVEEKSSRVVEVLLARIPPRNLLAGKIAGIGLLGLGSDRGDRTRSARGRDRGRHRRTYPRSGRGALVWAVVWFVLGYALYATLFGALGSLASRPEDAQSAAGPVSVVLVLGVLRFVRRHRQPRHKLGPGRVVVPGHRTDRHAYPHRHGRGHWWDPLLAAVLTIAAIAGLVVLGGRVYANAVLHNGPTLKLRDAWHTETPGLRRGRARESDHRGEQANEPHRQVRTDPSCHGGDRARGRARGCRGDLRDHW